MTALSNEIARIKNELGELGFKWLNGITIEEFLKRIVEEVEENNNETRT